MIITTFLSQQICPTEYIHLPNHVSLSHKSKCTTARTAVCYTQPLQDSQRFVGQAGATDSRPQSYSEYVHALIIVASQRQVAAKSIMQLYPAVTVPQVQLYVVSVQTQLQVLESECLDTHLINNYLLLELGLPVLLGPKSREHPESLS